jgi:aspartate/methionine/tyrosine aminotransferase
MCNILLFHPGFPGVIDFVIYSGISILPTPIQEKFEDESDKVFYEVAKSTKAYLVN